MSQADRAQRVSAAFVAPADTLVDEYDVIDLLDQLVRHCVALLPADAAGLLLGDARQELRLVAASDEDAQTVELLQLQAEEGPCLEAFRTIGQVRVPDLSRVPHRWPRFAAAATRHGAFASVHAILLRLRGRAIGALNLLHRTPGPLPDPDLALAQALADVATIGILQERTIRRSAAAGQLQAALDSRCRCRCRSWRARSTAWSRRTPRTERWSAGRTSSAPRSGTSSPRSPGSTSSRRSTASSPTAGPTGCASGASTWSSRRAASRGRSSSTSTSSPAAPPTASSTGSPASSAR